MFNPHRQSFGSLHSLVLNCFCVLLVPVVQIAQNEEQRSSVVTIVAVLCAVFFAVSATVVFFVWCRKSVSSSNSDDTQTNNNAPIGNSNMILCLCFAFIAYHTIHAIRLSKERDVWISKNDMNVVYLILQKVYIQIVLV